MNILTDEEMKEIHGSTFGKGLQTFARAIESAVLEKLRQQEPEAYATEDGERVVTEKTYAGARRDGGAIWSSMRPFSVPLYAAPVPAAEAPAMQKGIK